MKRLEYKCFIRNGLSNLKYCSGVKRNSKYISFAGNTVQIKTDIQSNAFVFHDIKKIAGERCKYKLCVGKFSSMSCISGYTHIAHK